MNYSIRSTESLPKTKPWRVSWRDERLEGRSPNRDSSHPSTTYEVSILNQGHVGIAWFSLGAAQACYRKTGPKRARPSVCFVFRFRLQSVDGREQTYGD